MLAAMAPTARLMASYKPEGDSQSYQAIKELQYISIQYKVQIYFSALHIIYNIYIYILT